MMQVLSVAAEAYPLVKTGGLGDVVGALPGALASHGTTVTTLLPGYPVVHEHIGNAPLVHRYGNLMGAEARILASRLNGHPLLVLGMMDRIARAAETTEALPPQNRRAREDRPRGYAAAVTNAARVLAEDLEASAIVGVTRSGLTAELLSRGRARVPIFAFSPDEGVCRRLALWWGVIPVHQHLADDLQANIDAMERYLVESGSAAIDDTVVIAGSHPFEVGVHTNFVKFHILS